MINLREQFILLVLRSNNFKLPSSTLDFKLGLSTAFIFDLIKEGVFNFKEPNKISLVNKSGEPLVNEIMKPVDDKAEQDLEYWLRHIVNYIQEIKNSTLERLETKNIITKIVKIKFIIFKSISYEIQDMLVIDNLIENMNKVLTTQSLTEKDHLYLISLIYACNYSSELFGKDDLTTEQIEKIKADDCCCCSMIDGIQAVKSSLQQFYAYYYHPMM